jgi:glucose-6-phosphate 1-dehydrogenase
MRLQPDEAIYMKLAVKQPGLEMQPVVSEMDLSYKQRYQGADIPDAYERLILDAIRGDQQHFVRRC